MKAEIDCVAVTDHNSGAWIAQLQGALAALESEMPPGYRKLHLFPGVELSVNGGVHLLAILDQGKSTPDIDSLLGAVGYGGTKGSSDNVTTKTFVEVVNEVVKAGGMAIPAHVDEANGLFMLQGTTLGQALAANGIVAMEVVSAASAKPGLYSARNLSWAEVLGSDAHRPIGQTGERYPGSHFTWIKMGQPTLEGLRLALQDGNLSVRRSDVGAGDPNAHAPLVIEAIEIASARYMGRSEPFQLHFNPWLNTIIGGRGSGKSTLLEFLRIALRRDGGLPDSLKQDFEKYKKVYQSREDEGLLTPDAAFDVTYRKDGTRFRVRWNVRGDAKPIEMEEKGGAWKAEEGEVAQRFPIAIYSQKEIFEIAKSPLALLRIVDESPKVDRRTWNNDWRSSEAKLLSLRAQAREIESGLADEPRLKGELEDVRRRLSIFEGSGHAAVLKEYQKRLRQQQAIQDWERAWGHIEERVRTFALGIVPKALDTSAFSDDAAEDKELLSQAEAYQAKLTEAQAQLVKSAAELGKDASAWTSGRNSSDWRKAVEGAIAAYEELRARLQAEGVADTNAYGELVERRQSLEGKLNEFESKRVILASLKSEGEACVTNLLEMRKALTQRRTEFLSAILSSNPYVHISVEPYGSRENAAADFRRLLQREDGGFEKDLEAIVSKIYQHGQDAHAIEGQLLVARSTLRAIATGAYSGDALSDRRFAPHVGKLPPEVFDRLDAWYPEDSLAVEYSTSPDGTGFRPIQEGSPGQKTAALLAFLFSYGQAPMILDQPEDDLDNQLVYDLIVKQLRRVKPNRQVIVVTHNANIVVNGDAEIVVSLKARNGETHIESAGSLQELSVRETVCSILEGGREAFKQRYKRIALELGAS